MAITRISVQRELAPVDTKDVPAGLVSNYLHDTIMQGDELDVHMSAGDFILQESDRPVVLLSGGSGITAVLTMLQHLVSPQGGGRDVLFIHSVRRRERHAFNHEIRGMICQHPNVRAITLYGKAAPDDHAGQDHDGVGRITTELLQQHLPKRGADFYFCGPIRFMDAMESVLNELHVPLEQRHSEAFEPDRSFAIPAESQRTCSV